MGLLEVNGLSLPLLAELSYPSQLGRSLKNNLGSFDKESLLLDALSAAEWLDMNPLLGEVAIDYRIKSEESIRTKYERYYPDRPVLKVFNDILGFRSCCDDYTEVLSLVSPRLKVVDMSRGKARDDGYRGVHLYYHADNFHYPIELQFNTLYDRPKGGLDMKETAPKKTWFQTLRTLWVPLAIGVVTVAALAVVVGMVWKDYRTAMMDSQTRQMELVVQSTADSIRVLLEEYADRLDSIAEKAQASKAFRPTVARSDTIRDVWLENSNGEVIYSCYGLSAVCDVLITRTENIAYWQYHSGGEHYLVMKRKAGDETVCLVVDSTVMYQQLISEIHVGRNGYIMIKNNDNLVVMHPEAVQWGIKVVEGRQRIYQGKELDMSSLSELLRAQQEEESGTLDYYSYWWADPELPRVHKISAFRHLDVGSSFWIVSAVVDYDDFYEPVQQSFVKVVLIFGGVALVLVLFMFQMFRLQERDRRSATEISDLKTLNQTLEELHRSEESLAHGQRLQMMGTLTGGIAHEFNNFLTPITGYADLIMADADPGSEIYDNAMEISEAAQKAQEVVKQISSMSRKNVETVYDAVSVEGLLHRTRKLVETNCPKNVELKEENELSGECVLGNATQLQQVMLNISINAIHAIGAEGGKLTIRGSVVPRSELAALFPEEKISEEWSSYVCLSVTDTGCGMDKETMQHIFEPFFTTKKTGEGTGLGLALADQIIRTHRGRIRAESTIGRGTTFYVYLPVLEQQQEREQLQWGVDSKLRILAADDNNKVLDLLDKDLSALGLSVSTCSRRGELRQLLEQQPFDVLAIDESLMSSSGVDFCMAIRGRYPGMTRIVMTNAPTREIVDARSHGVIDGYVVKPVSASTLLAQIRSSRKE